MIAHRRRIDVGSLRLLLRSFRTVQFGVPRPGPPYGKHGGGHV